MSYDDTEAQSPRVPIATYRARGVRGSVQLASSEGGNPYVTALFEIVDSACPQLMGETVAFFGFFTTEKSEKRTFDSLRIAGWSNDDISDIQGFGDTEVDIEVEHHEWQSSLTARVKWVNRAGSGIAVKSPMTDADKKSFAAKIKAKAVLSRQGQGKNAVPRKKTETPAPAVDDDVGF